MDLIPSSLGELTCKTKQDSWRCPNMKEVEGDLDMNYEHYECKICGKTMKLDYDEMR